LLPGRKAANAKCKRSQEPFECFTERLVIVDDGNDWTVTHQSLLTRCAMRLLSARHHPTACRHQATYTETPQRGRFSGPDMTDFLGRLYPTIAEPALGRPDRPSLGELAFGRGRLVPRGEKTSSSATLTSWATGAASIFRISCARWASPWPRSCGVAPRSVCSGRHAAGAALVL